MNKPFVPHITEKSYSLISEEKGMASAYTFEVPRVVTKGIVKAQIEKQFKVHVIDVRIINLPGKVRRFKGVMGKTQATKKAIVRLKAGERIADFLPAAPEDKKDNK